MRRLITRKNWGVLFNQHALWLGIHYSPYNKRACVNLIPMVTIWFTRPGGQQP